MIWYLMITVWELPYLVCKCRIRNGIWPFQCAVSTASETRNRHVSSNTIRILSNATGVSPVYVSGSCGNWDDSCACTAYRSTSTWIFSRRRGFERFDPCWPGLDVGFLCHEHSVPRVLPPLQKSHTHTHKTYVTLGQSCGSTYRDRLAD